MAGWALAVVLVVYNNAMNRWPPFRGPLYVPANLALTLAVVAVAFGPLGLDAQALGFGGGQGAGLVLGIAAGAAVAAPLFLALGSRRTAGAVADRRMEGLGNRELAWRALVRVPLGTALCEEVLFRGVLYAALGGSWSAALWSSAAFGLWHIAPTYNLLEENRSATSPAAAAGKVAAGIVLTAAAGMFLVWLRIAGGGIAAPFGFHAAVNSLGTVAAALALRRRAGAAAQP